MNSAEHETLRREGSEAHYRDGAYYDRRYRSRQSDVRFYVDAALQGGGPVLELGVGTGRVARKLAEAHIEVVGVDAMGPMLQQARRRLTRCPRTTRERVQLVQADIRMLRLARRFPLIIAPFNVFMHLYSRQDIEAALAVVQSHLAPEGRLIFDVTNPDPRALARDPTRVYRCKPIKEPGTGRRVDYSEAFHYDGPTQVMHMSLIHEPVDAPGDVHIAGLSQRQFFPAELEALLHYNGFQVNAVFGDFDRAPLSTQSRCIIVESTPFKTTGPTHTPRHARPEAT